MSQSRDAGLVRTVGPWALSASILNVIIGAGIFAVPAAAASSVGVYAPLAFLVCAVAIGAVAICFAEGGSRIPTSGGAYGYIEAALGPLAGYVSGTLLWLSDVLACSGVVAALAAVAASLVPPAYATSVRFGLIVAVIGIIAAINIAGVEQGARLIKIATVVKLLPLLIFVGVGAGAIHLANFSQTIQPNTMGIGRAAILALFSFSGMETALSASGEVENPSRTIPRALLIAMTSVTVLYVAIQAVAQGILGPALGVSTSPLADAMARISPSLRLLMLGGALISMLGFVGTDLLSTPRTLFALARAGWLPRILGRVHPRTHTPYAAIICYAVAAIVLASTGTFAELAVLSSLAVAALYIGVCAAAWKLARTGVAEAGTPLNFRPLGLAAVIGIVSMCVLIVLGSRDEILGLAAVIAISSVVYLVQSNIRASRSRD